MENIEFSVFEKVSKGKLKDCADLLNSTITPIILTLFITITCVKAYLMSPITCYASTIQSGAAFEEYMKSYCWTHGTMVFTDNRIPNPNEWDKAEIKRIAYYQWIPFLLGIQCALFYLPNIIWRIACHHSHGTDLEFILQKTKRLAEDDSDNKLCEQIVSTLEDLFFVHRDYRQGELSKLRRKIHKKCNLLIISKRLGTKLSMCYIFVKLLYLLNVIGQLFLMDSFLKLDVWSGGAYGTIWKLIQSGDDWHKSIYFPRTSYCRITELGSVGVMNSYVVQCTLPINLLNEKIFIFLFLWLPIVLVVTAYSMLSWLCLFVCKARQVRIIKNYLKMRQNYKKMDKMAVEKFVQQFLRQDGMFLLSMILRHGGDVVTSSIVNGLYRTYREKFRHCDFNKDKSADETQSLSLKLEPGGKGSVKNLQSKKPTAPDNNLFL